MKALLTISLLAAGLVVGQLPEELRRVGGRVVDALSGRPIANAKVTLGCVVVRTSSDSVKVLTGPDGTFRVSNLPTSTEWPRLCNASVYRLGFLPISDLAVVESPILVKLIPQTVITGVVYDENGEAIPFAQVRVFRQVVTGGHSALSSAPQTAADDRGRFRIAQLAAGKYRVCVNPPQSSYLTLHRLAYTRTCAQATVDEEWIPLKAGETRDLRFDLKPVSSVRVSGHVSNAPPRVFLQLSRAGIDGSLEPYGTYRWDNVKSTFEFPAVVPGEYQLVVLESTGTVQSRAARIVMVGASDIIDLELTMRPDLELKGRVVFDDTSARSPDGLQILFQTVKGAGAVYANVAADGSFTKALRSDENYEIGFNFGRPLHVKSIRQGGRDITDRALQIQTDESWGGPIEVIASSSHGSIQGSVRIAKNEENFVVSALQQRPSGLKLVSAAAVIGQGTRFELKDLPPGEYLLFASRRSVNVPYLERSYVEGHSKYVVHVRVIDGEVSRLEIDPLPDEPSLP
jgi:hypothetical protein